MRVAALADVHGNAPALAAVLEEVEAAAPDLVVFGGDLTWGSLPRETLALVRSLRTPARFVRGNGDRAVGTLLEGRGEWMAAMHSPEDIEFVNGFDETVSLDVDGLGPTCFCHGSPRSDVECVTERTPAERVHEFMAGVDERVVVTGHVHVQYDRTVDGMRLLSPGSVGLPYEGERARTGRSSARTSSSGARSTTSRQPSHRCERPPIRAWSRSSSSCSSRLPARRRSSTPRMSYSLSRNRARALR
jgi:putative phosphoesterase